MSRQASPISGKPYGLAAVCRVWRLTRSGIYRQRTPAPAPPLRRRGPVGPMPDAALLEAIRTVLAASPFHGEGHRKIWARLRMTGTRTSLRRVLRLMRENGLLAPSRVGTPRGPRNHDGTIIPETVDTMWGTDLTTTIISEGQVAVFVAVDHCSAECVGIHAAHRGHPLRGARADPPSGGGVTSARSARTSPAASPSATTMGPSTCPTPSRRSSPSSASRVRQPSSAHPREMAAPSDSSAPSRRTSSGCGPSKRSSNCGWRCSISARPITPPG